MSLLRPLSLLLISFALAAPSGAVPVTFTGQAEISSLQSTFGLLDDFLGVAPSAGDVLSFSVTYDFDTVGVSQPTGAPETVIYSGGLTAVSILLNGVTLSANTTGPGLSSVIVSTHDMEVLGIPGFFDGYGLTGGSATNANGERWAANFFFYYGGLTSLDAPTTIPDFSQFQFVGLGFRSFDTNQNFDGFGALVQDLGQVPEPSAVVFLLAAAAGLLGARKRA
jgi:hypothetical protein